MSVFKLHLQTARDRVSKTIDQERAPGLLKHLATVSEIFSTFESECSQVLTDKNYSDIGRKDVIKKRAADAFKSLDLLKASVGYRTKIGYLLEEVKPSTPSGDPVTNYLQMAEIRSELKGMDPLMRNSLIKQRAFEGDDSLLQAAASAPAAFPLADQETLDESFEVWRRAKHPQIFQEVDVLENLAGTFESVLKTAEQEITKSADIQPTSAPVLLGKSA